MNRIMFARRSLAGVVLGLGLVLSSVEAPAQDGPVTSRLRRVLVYFYNYGASDHMNTPTYAAYIRTLGINNGFTVDTTRSQSVFTSANLANYDLIFLFSAYYFGQNMTTTQKSAVEAWYAGNKGIACFHQCVRNNWGGTYPNWYDNLMGVQYQTYAGFTTGPVYVDSSVVGTDLAMSSTGTQYPANYTQSWDDEWYTYAANPRNLPNTKMIWTTRRSSFNFGGGSSGFYLSGEEQPMAWARQVQGGRFVLSSHFHRDAPRTSTNSQLRTFIDGHFLGVMRYLAGYNGCTDPQSPNYNPKATHNDPAVCATSSLIRISADNAFNGVRIGSLKVSVKESGAHSVDVFNSRGRKTVSYRGTGPREYDFPQLREPGVYYVRARSGSGSVSKRLLLL